MAQDQNSVDAGASQGGSELVLYVGQVVSDIYTILDKRKPDDVPTDQAIEVADSLGEGGSGTVYLASYRGMQKRAIKFLTLNYLSDETGKRASDFLATFNRERIFLSTLSHGNIARLYDTGSYTDQSGREWQYIVTDYIEGEELLPALAKTTAQQAYSLISDVLRAIAYMHSKGVLHSDIKTENIKCRGIAPGVEAVVLDLGTAQYVPEVGPAGQAELPFDKFVKVRFITTKRITHQREHEKYREKQIDKETLRALFPYHDIHAIGVLLKEAIAVSDIKAKLVSEIGQEGLSALHKMIYNLQRSPEPDDPPNSPDYNRTRRYASVQQVYQDWLKLKRTYLAPVGVPELSLAAEFKYSVPTAAGRGVITPRLSFLINHKLFQRLRRVPQLEMTYLKFPGATHTRFSHAMTTLRNTRYYLAHLLNDPNFRLLVEPSDLEATILLSLLHDVGHYQLSHMFEDLAAEQRSGKEDYPWEHVDFDIPTDDDLFWSIIDPTRNSEYLRGNYGERIAKACRESAKKLGYPEDAVSQATLAKLLCDEFGTETYESMQRIHHAIYRPGKYADPTHAQLVLGAVLSSDIDADKVSYLIEDAARSGVNYGAGVDFDGLLGALRMPAIGHIGKRPTLGITQKGLAAAQSVVLSRNLMVGQVYWHHSNRAATAMIKYVVARQLVRGALSVPEYVQDTLFEEYDSSLKYLSAKFERRDGEVNPIVGLLEGERGIYHTAFSTARGDKSTGEAERISEALTRKTFAGIIKLEEQLCEVVRGVAGVGPVASGEVLADIPTKERERPAGDRGGQVFVYNDRSETAGHAIHEYTPFLRAIKDQHIRENRVCRVFVSPRIAAMEQYDKVVKAVERHMYATIAN